jgi:hypothetical protein
MADNSSADLSLRGPKVISKFSDVRTIAKYRRCYPRNLSLRGLKQKARFSVSHSGPRHGGFSKIEKP